MSFFTHLDCSGPRWVPDPEVCTCFGCKKSFDWFNRKHHCRHCGRIFCNPCSSHQSLLPQQFGFRDAQRVCDACHKLLLPRQRHLIANIADYQRVNPVSVAVDDASWEGWSPRRYLNMPYSKTLGSAIRKAAYATYNVIGCKYIRDSSVATSMIASAKGLVFMTVGRAGVGFGAAGGTGLLIARLPDGRWSGPVAVGVVGICWGALLGMSISDCILGLNSTEALSAFAGRAQIAIGLTAEVSLGPIGRYAMLYIIANIYFLSFFPFFYTLICLQSIDLQYHTVPYCYYYPISLVCMT